MTHGRITIRAATLTEAKLALGTELTKFLGGLPTRVQYECNAVELDASMIEYRTVIAGWEVTARWDL